MAYRYEADTSTFEFAYEACLDSAAERSAFAIGSASRLRRIDVEEGLDRSTMVVFRQTPVDDPFDPSLAPADARVCGRFDYGGETCDGLEISVSQENMVGGWIALRSVSDGEPPDPDIAIPRTKITDPTWNTFIRTAAPPAGYSADLILYLWTPARPIAKAGWVAVQVELRVPSGTDARGRTTRTSEAGRTDAFGQAAPAVVLHNVGKVKLALG